MSRETTVRDILDQKEKKQILTIGPNDSVFRALREMALHNVGALLVMDFGKVVGIVSERDYARKVVLKDRTSRETQVSEIMESRVLYVVPRDTAEGCMALMTEKRIRHLPVFEHGELVGLISIGDILKAVIEDHEYLIDQLICYTTGSTVGKYDGSNFASRARAEERVLG